MLTYAKLHFFFAQKLPTLFMHTYQTLCLMRKKKKEIKKKNCRLLFLYITRNNITNAARHMPANARFEYRIRNAKSVNDTELLNQW